MKTAAKSVPVKKAGKSVPVKICDFILRKYTKCSAKI